MAQWLRQFLIFILLTLINSFKCVYQRESENIRIHLGFCPVSYSNLDIWLLLGKLH